MVTHLHTGFRTPARSTLPVASPASCFLVSEGVWPARALRTQTIRGLVHSHRICSPSSQFWVYLQVTRPVNLQRKAPGWRPDKTPEPPQLTPPCTPSSLRTSELTVSIRRKLIPGCLYSRSHSCGHLFSLRNPLCCSVSTIGSLGTFQPLRFLV